MNQEKLLAAYRSWSGSRAKKIPAPIPIGSVDVFEDDSRVVNRLFYLVPDMSSGTLRCFFFFEENTFTKDSFGDLELAGTTFHPLNP